MKWAWDWFRRNVRNYGEGEGYLAVIATVLAAAVLLLAMIGRP